MDDRLVMRCERLRALHVPGNPLVLPNAWDAASARVVATAGFPAVATTSGGVAASLGFDDHEGAPAAEMLEAAGRIVRSVDLPVTVDVEAGYGLDVDDLVDRLRSIGAAGINLEDSDHGGNGLTAVDRQAERFASIRDAASQLGYPIVLNARIDVVLADRGRSQSELVEACVKRARAYLEAGADCVFPIFLHEREPRRAFVDAVCAPVNLLLWPTGNTVSELAADGVARVSYGTLLHRQAMEWLDETIRSR